MKTASPEHGAQTDDVGSSGEEEDRPSRARLSGESRGKEKECSRFQKKDLVVSKNVFLSLAWDCYLLSEADASEVRPTERVLGIDSDSGVQAIVRLDINRCCRGGG